MSQENVEVVRRLRDIAEAMGSRSAPPIGSSAICSRCSSGTGGVQAGSDNPSGDLGKARPDGQNGLRAGIYVGAGLGVLLVVRGLIEFLT